MKKNLTLVFFMLLFYGCFSQTKDDLIEKYEEVNSLKVIKDSTDIILNKFGDSTTEKILIYIENKGFKMITNKNNKFSKYDVIGDQIKLIDTKKNLKCNKKEFKILSRAFDFELYKKKYMNKKQNFKYSRGNLMYFVAIDKKQNKFSEFYLPCYTFPTIIEQDLLLYILKLYSNDSCPANHIEL